jgi:cytochrome c-type biogenesis protein CcmH/NrfF
MRRELRQKRKLNRFSLLRCPQCPRRRISHPNVDDLLSPSLKHQLRRSLNQNQNQNQNPFLL